MPVTPQVVTFPFAISSVETNFIFQALFVIVSIESSSLWDECLAGGFRDPSPMLVSSFLVEDCSSALFVRHRP